jgi:hypothetical protein
LLNLFFFKFHSIEPILINGEVEKIVKVRGTAEGGATGVGGATGDGGGGSGARASGGDSNNTRR